MWYPQETHEVQRVLKASAFYRHPLSLSADARHPPHHRMCYTPAQPCDTPGLHSYSSSLHRCAIPRFAPNYSGQARHSLTPAGECSVTICYVVTRADSVRTHPHLVVHIIQIKQNILEAVLLTILWGCLRNPAPHAWDRKH